MKILISLLISLSAANAMAEMRCGWVQNLIPGNWSLVDGDGQWDVYVTGEHEYGASGNEIVENLKVPKDQFIVSKIVEGATGTGYYCGCITGDTANIDGLRKMFTKIVSAKANTLKACLQDTNVPPPPDISVD